MADLVDVQLKLFGQVGWTRGNTFTPVGGSTRIGVILCLAEAGGAAVSVARLLDRLWPSPPRSGANAVQRHVSALRSQLHELGVESPGEVIEWVPNGYRLRGVCTDLDQVEQMLENSFGSTVGLDAVSWWEEPLMGAPWQSVELLHSRMTRVASQALRKWAEDLPADSAVHATHRAESMLAHSPEAATATDVLHRMRRQIRRANSQQLAPAGVTTLREVAGLWIHGRSDDALDLLELKPESLPPDLARRLCRAFIWLDPHEPWARHIVSAIVEDGVSNPEQHERSVITLDARVLEVQPDGEAIAQAEVDSAHSEWDLVRSLRVQYLLGLSAPHDPKLDGLIDRLASIDHPDAQVECRRFRFLSQLRLGHFAELVDLLNDYTRAVYRYWPGSGDDFAPMSIAALQRSLDPAIVEIVGPAGSSFAVFAADRWVLPLVETTRRLMLNDPREPLSDTEYFVALNAMSRTAQNALRLLRDLNGGRPVEAQAQMLAEGLDSTHREKQFLMMPVALCLVAEALCDRSIAEAASTALEPWAGQMLGMWPVDAFFGPADHWLDRLAAV